MLSTRGSNRRTDSSYITRARGRVQNLTTLIEFRVKNLKLYYQPDEYHTLHYCKKIDIFFKLHRIFVSHFLRAFNKRLDFFPLINSSLIFVEITRAPFPLSVTFPPQFPCNPNATIRFIVYPSTGLFVLQNGEAEKFNFSRHNGYGYGLLTWHDDLFICIYV